MDPCRSIKDGNKELSSILLLLLQLTLVESKLITFKNITVSSAGLAGARSDASEKAAALELVLDAGINFLVSQTVLLLREDMTAPLLGLFLLFCPLLFFAQINTIPPQIPLLVRLCIDLNDGVF